MTSVTILSESADTFAIAFMTRYSGTERLRRLYIVNQLLRFSWANPTWKGPQILEAVTTSLAAWDGAVDGPEPLAAPLQVSWDYLSRLAKSSTVRDADTIA